MGILSVAGAFLFVAGGGGSVSPTTVPSPVTDSSSPSATNGEGGVSPTQTAQPSSPGEPSGAQARPSTGYAWQIEPVDTNAGKPSLAVDADGMPHIAYMLEAMPGFVKYAVRNGEAWDITTVSSGYFYGPLDIQVGGQGRPQISYHDHDNEDGAYAVLVDG